MKEAIYQGHGQIESYPVNSALWGVIAHEQRHANFNKYIASNRNEEVEQSVKISIRFEDGHPVPVDAYTEAKFKKSDSEENFLKLLFVNFKISKTKKEIADEKNNKNNLFLKLQILEKELQNIKKKIFDSNGVSRLFDSKKEYAKFYGIFDFQKYNIPPVVIHNPFISGYLVNEVLKEQFKEYEGSEHKKFSDIVAEKEAYKTYQKDIWDNLFAKFLSFQDFLNDFNINFFKVENDNEDYFDVDITGDIEKEENISLNIEQVAKSFTVYSKKFDDAYTALNISGKVYINGVEVDISTSDSLYDIAQTINWGEDTNENGVLDFDENEDTNGNEELDGGSREHGVYAYIEDNRLYLKNLETGDRTIVITDSNNIFHDFEIIKENPVNDGIYFPNVLQKGENAVYSVNGKNYISEDNFVNYNGLTISFHEPTSGEKSFKVSQDNEGAYENILSFVDNYNYIVQSLNNVLTDDNIANKFTPKIIKRGLKIAVFSDVSSNDIKELGLDLKENKETLNEMEVLFLKEKKNYNNSIYKKLLSFGLKDNDDETISVDSGTLKNSIKKDFSNVKEVFLSEDGVIARLKDFVEQVVDEDNGIISFHLDSLSSEDLEKIETYYNKEKITSEYLSDKLEDIISIVESLD